MTFKNYTNENKLKGVKKEIQEAIGSYYDHSFNFELFDQIAAVLGRMDQISIEEAIAADTLDNYVYSEADTEIIYRDQKIILIEYYGDIDYLDFDIIFDNFVSDIIKIIKIMKSQGWEV